MPLRTPLQLVTFEEVVTHELPAVDWLVTDLVANQDRVVLYGEFGSLKSWLLLDLALAIAAQQRWLGRFRVPSRKKVLYIDEEMNERVLRRRVKQLSMGSAERMGDLPFRALSWGGFTAGTGEDVQALLRELATTGFDPDVIILETLRRVMVGSELDAQDVARFWNNLSPLQGKTVIVSHHMRKPSVHGSSEVRYRASGSTDILGAADTAVAVTRTDPSRVLLEVVKSRNAEEQPRFAASLCNREGEARCWQFDRFEMQEVTPTAQRRAFDLIIRYLTEIAPSGARPGTIQQSIVNQGIQPRTYERAWKQVRESGRVESRGQIWSIREGDLRVPTESTPPTASLYRSDGGGAFMAPPTPTVCASEYGSGGGLNEAEQQDVCNSRSASAA